MPDFLAENNTCGQTILHLVSRGNAIIAELLRLKDYIPKIYRLETKQEIQKYADIIMDFSYFKIAEIHDQKIENNESLQDLDEEFRDNHIEIINRFYLAFESIHTYIVDLNRFLDELEEGLYIHQSLETIFTDLEGKQLMCEALYLYGLMLLIIDAYIEGIVRERLLVSYYRYNPQRSDTKSCIDEVCKLLRDTGNLNKKPNNYPEDYFKRIEIKSVYIDMVIGRLRSDDIYGQLSVYPLPKHRSTALATQASMLYICLFFSTNILHNQTAVMREIVDKYFPDNWIISIYMGFIINLIETWDSFKAAKLALNNTLELINIKTYSNNYGSSVLQLLKSTNLLLKEGNITNESLLKDVGNIINLLRDCNFTIRWLMLHTLFNNKFDNNNNRNKRIKQIRELVILETKYEQVQLFKLLLNTAQLELITKDIFKNLLNEKDKHWDYLKNESYKSLIELSDVFSGLKPLTRIEKNIDLYRWFLEISKQIETLNHNDSRKIIQLINALEEVQEFHQLETNMQVIQYLIEIRKYLNQMIHLMNIKEDILIQLQIIGDLSYAWDLIDLFTPIMQFGIKREPTLVIKLRAIFLKLSSALEIPLLRINQSHSDDLISVSQYYSSELEIYVRKVLQIIPKMMFDKLSRIIHIQTNILNELPTRLDKDKLKDYAQLNERFEFAELTHSISVFGQGMRKMKNTLVGVISLDPKQLLEDGIRIELVQYISKSLHTELNFLQKSNKTNFDLELKLKNLTCIMDGYKRSFEYIQDYININGLKIWQEEVTRIINYNVEQECNGFLRNKIHGWQSIYQSRYVPIPIYPAIDNCSVNFVGQLAREVIRLTDPKQYLYLEQTSSWYDIKTHKPVVNKQTIASIASAIEIAGLVGIDRLFSFMIITNLQKLSGYLENKNIKSTNNNWTNILTNIHKDIKSFDDDNNTTTISPLKFYQNCINRTTKIWNDFLDCMLIVGQLQLLRNLIAFHLNKSCKFNAKNMDSSLRALNDALLLDIKNEKYNPNEEFMLTLSHYFDYSGLNKPFNKIYITSKFNEDYSITIFMFVIVHLHKMFILQQVGNLNKKNLDQIDGTAFAVAVHTILKQFHSKLNDNFIKLISDFILRITKYNISTKSTELSSEVSLAINFLDNYTNYSENSRKSLKDYIPEEILHLQQALISSLS